VTLIVLEKPLIVIVRSRLSWFPSTSRALVYTLISYVELGASSWEGAMIARRLSAGSRRTLKGTAGVMVSELLMLARSMPRENVSVR